MTRDDLAVILMEVRMGDAKLREAGDRIWKALNPSGTIAVGGNPVTRLNSMVCAECKKEESRVADSRSENGGRWRRRVCKCGNQWYTEEVVR